MINDKLAILGGPKAIDFVFKRYNHIGKEEIESVNNVMRSGVLSKYMGSFNDDFLGGPKVKEFEINCFFYFGVYFAIIVNSWTSN